MEKNYFKCIFVEKVFPLHFYAKIIFNVNSVELEIFLPRVDVNNRNAMMKMFNVYLLFFNRQPKLVTIKIRNWFPMHYYKKPFLMHSYSKNISLHFYSKIHIQCISLVKTLRLFVDSKIISHTFISIRETIFNTCFNKIIANAFLL